MQDAPVTTPQEAPAEPDVEQLHFVYFADPMCSWCYGFAPVIDELSATFKDRLGLRVVVGGLRAGNTQAMRDQDRDYIRNAWTRVGEASGRPFDFAFFDRDHFVYDTEPACRAVVTVRQLHPGRELTMKGAISEAFYANNRDTTDTDTLADIADAQGIDRQMFINEFQRADTRNATARDFYFAQQSGVQGFPCLVVGREKDGYALITNGFRPIDGMVDGINRWLADQNS